MQTEKAETTAVPARSEARRMLNVEGVLAIIPIGRTTLFRMERDGRFPASHYVSANRRFWYEDEVIAWQDALPSNRRIRRSKG